MDNQFGFKGVEEGFGKTGLSRFWTALGAFNS
ncbi:hypothetical protein N42HA_00615 [Lactococcus lactis]|nr:hypothetical protein [Lactococcus lactis]